MRSAAWLPASRAEQLTNLHFTYSPAMNVRKSRNGHLRSVQEKEELTESLHLVEALHDLRLAAIRGTLEDLKTALAKGITVNQTLKGGWTALMYACSTGHPTLVEYLLQKGANPSFHKELFTPLMAVCASTQRDENRLVQCVDLLLKHKADINTVERHHISALMFAAKEGHTKVVARLLAGNCNCDIDAQDSQGWTALFWAVNQGRMDVVEVLVRKGARVDVQDSRSQTPMDLARTKGLSQIIDVLMGKHTRPPDSWPELNHEDMKEKNIFVKGADSMLQALLDELSASIISNNARYGSNFTRLLNSMDPENDLEELKVNGHVKLKDADSVNGFCQNSILFTDKSSQIALAKQKNPIQMSWRNIPYSAVEAREVLSHIVQHLDSLYASMSYVRLHMQGNPPAALVEDKHATISEIAALSSKVLHCSRLLYDEAHFFHQYAKQLGESDRVVPADLIIEQKTDRHYSTVISSCVIAAAVVVILFNSRILTLSVFSK